MDTLYEVVYRRTRRSIFRKQGEDPIDAGNLVVVDVDGRREVGEVVWKGVGERLAEIKDVDGYVIRQASDEDQEICGSLRKKEKAALEVFKMKIGEHGLPMKPVEVEYEEDGCRITFYFTAENRVDFRKLVRDLAHIYHTRIELRQISPRKEAQRLGGCGTCGRPLCCATFMKNLQPVPAQAAQEQALSQNLSKLVGVCGQLKCCLRYELDFYQEAKERFPPVGSRVACGGQVCRVEKNDIFEDLVQIRNPEGERERLPLVDVEIRSEGTRG